MGIQRYSASIDTTITNAYQMNLTTRATGANMGLADTLEVFSIYGQQASASSELSRILIKFPVSGATSSIGADRDAGSIPASGSVNFYLRMYNTKHAFTVPKNFNLNISAVSRSWEEGYGLDMDNYQDLSYNDVGANWINAASGSPAATLLNAIDCQGLAQNDAFTMTVPAAAGGDAVAHQFVFDNTTDINALSDTTGFGISMTVASSYELMAAALVDAINGTATSAVQYGGAAIGAGSTLTAGTLGLTAAVTSTTKVTLTMDDGGAAGNVANVLAANTGFEGDLLLERSFTGGGNDWTTEGGDYYSDTSSSFSASFDDGTEDIEVDVTSVVEQWLNSDGNLAGKKPNHGFLIMHPLAKEATARSYYTKKFFARSSQYVLKRPVIEARWDSSTKDDAGNFYSSSSLATGTENLNTIYLYNTVRGRLRNIPVVGNGPILVSIYSGSTSATGSAPEGDKYTLPIGGNVVADDDLNVTGGIVSTGIYSASFAYTGSATSIYPVWHNVSLGQTIPPGDGRIVFHTGSAITVKSFDSDDYNPHPSYVSKITNLRDSYSIREKITRFRLHIREKDWNPNIYTKASKEVPTVIVEDVYYRLYRTIDRFEVVAYGTGSADHTRLSFDASGSYFDFPVDILESGYSYAFKFLYKMPDGNYREQPETFKFRVD